MSEKKKSYKEFCDALKMKILGNPSWGVTQENYKFYAKGFQGEKDSKEQEFVVATNLRYYGEASEVLQGDFIALNLHTAGETECMCRFSMEYLFAEYEEGDWEKVEYILQENISLAAKTNLDHMIANLTEYEVMKERLMIRPINYSDNSYELQNHVYKLCGDIALVLYATLYNDQRGLGAIKMPKRVIESWNVNVDTLFEEALTNTYIQAQPRLYTALWDTLYPTMEKGIFMSVNGDVQAIEKFQVPIVTTTRKINGAIAMFYPGVKEKIAELIGSSYYVAFTSIHEARVHHCDSISHKMIEESLREVNESFDTADVLSRVVFYYNAERKTFQPVTNI